MKYMNLLLLATILVLPFCQAALTPEVSGELCDKPCNRCHRGFVLTRADTNHFYFNVADLLELTGYTTASQWANKEYYVTYTEKGTDKEERLIVTLNESSSSAEGKGSFHATNPIGDQPNFFEAGKPMGFMQHQKCTGCHGVANDPKRNAAPSCQCHEKYHDYYHQGSAQPKCELNCSRSCKDQKCSEDDLSECTECYSDDFYMPECTTPKKGFIKELQHDGSHLYKSCATKCASCSHRVDNCVTDVHGKLCNGYNRNDRDNCACDRGFHDNQGYHVDCVECKETCKTCDQSHKCLSCFDEQNRTWNELSGQCECKLGYTTKKDGDLKCEKCYQMAEECVFKCPEHTFANEQTQVCETIEYSMVSNAHLIIITTLILAGMQFGACMCIRTRLQNQYKKHHADFVNEQMKLRSQRQFIYANLEGHRFHKDNVSDVSLTFLDGQNNNNRRGWNRSSQGSHSSQGLNETSNKLLQQLDESSQHQLQGKYDEIFNNKSQDQSRAERREQRAKGRQTRAMDSHNDSIVQDRHQGRGFDFE